MDLDQSDDVKKAVWILLRDLNKDISDGVSVADLEKVILAIGFNQTERSPIERL